MAEATDVAADWNVIVTLPEATFREARKFLRRWGEVHRTGYFHVLTLTVDDIKGFLEEVTKAIEEKRAPSISSPISSRRNGPSPSPVPRNSRPRRAT